MNVYFTERKKNQYRTSFHKDRTKFYSTLTTMDGHSLQVASSAVTLNVAERIRAVITHAIHTNCTQFKNLIPDTECLISPIVEYSVMELDVEEYVPQYKYQISVPHCLQKLEPLSTIRIRCGDMEKKISFQIISCQEAQPDSSPYYEADEHFIRIYTNHFSTFICTSCEKICDAPMVAFLFGSLRLFVENGETFAKMKTFLCSSLYDLQAFQEVNTFCTKFILNCT